jgi:tetratricopeptide (TPR) repeat protein
MLFVALRMLRNLKPAAPPPVARTELGASRAIAPGDAMPGLDRGITGSDETSGARAIPAAAAGSEEDLQVRSVAAQKLQNAGDWAGLSAYAQAWLQAQPERNEPLLLLGTAETRLGNHEQAIAAIQKVLAREPGHAGAQALLAEAYLQAQRFAEAAALYAKLVAVSADDARLWNNYGAALNASGQQAQAVAALETAVRLDPSFKQAWTNLGNVYQSRGDTARASAAFANAR